MNISSLLGGVCRLLCCGKRLIVAAKTEIPYFIEPKYLNFYQSQFHKAVICFMVSIKCILVRFILQMDHICSKVQISLALALLYLGFSMPKEDISHGEW